MSNNNAAPDSWESQADSTSANNSPTQTADVTAKFSTLNVNAVEFVPSFAMPTVEVDENSPTKSEESRGSPELIPVLNGTSSFIFVLLYFDVRLLRRLDVLICNRACLVY